MYDMGVHTGHFSIIFDHQQMYISVALIMRKWFLLLLMMLLSVRVYMIARTIEYKGNFWIVVWVKGKNKYLIRICNEDSFLIDQKTPCIIRSKNLAVFMCKILKTHMVIIIFITKFDMKKKLKFSTIYIYIYTNYYITSVAIRTHNRNSYQNMKNFECITRK